MFDRVESGGGAAHGRLDDPAAMAALPKAARLALLRERMAAVPGKVGSATAATVPAHDVIPVPGVLGELLPGSGLAHGTVVACPRGYVLCALLAAATGAGQYAAVVGGLRPRRMGLLAAWEMGADLERLALVDADAGRAGEIVHVLVDGVPLVVLDVPGLRMRPAEVEGLRARVRSKGAVLVVTGGEWVRRPHLGIEVRSVGTEGIGQGTGRLRRLELDLRISVQGNVFRRGRVTLTGAEGGRTQWVHAAAAAAGPGMAHTG